MTLEYFEDFWVNYLYLVLVMHFFGLTLLAITVISGSEFTRTVTILFYVIMVVSLSAQISYEGVSNLASINAKRAIRRNHHQATHYVPLILDGGVKTNVRDFMEKIHKDDYLFIGSSCGSINF